MDGGDRTPGSYRKRLAAEIQADKKAEAARDKVLKQKQEAANAEVSWQQTTHCTSWCMLYVTLSPPSPPPPLVSSIMPQSSCRLLFVATGFDRTPFLEFDVSIAKQVAPSPTVALHQHLHIVRRSVCTHR